MATQHRLCRGQGVYSGCDKGSETTVISRSRLHDNKIGNKVDLLPNLLYICI